MSTLQKKKQTNRFIIVKGQAVRYSITTYFHLDTRLQYRDPRQCQLRCQLFRDIQTCHPSSRHDHVVRFGPIPNLDRRSPTK